MFIAAIVTGVYSYIIFFLGIMGFLYPLPILTATILYLLILAKITLSSTFKLLKLDSKLMLFFLLLLVLQLCINFIGVLGPELSFDALWYHLTLPKIYLQNHTIRYIPGGLFYYSAMPQLIEMYYVVGLALSNETSAKAIHFVFSIGILISLYHFSRRYIKPPYTLLPLIIFSSNLVVGWESITAYIDLGRTFYEFLAFTALLLFLEKKKYKYLVISAVLLGFAITAKLLAIGSIALFISIILIQSFKLQEKIKYSIIFISVAFLIPLPWFIFASFNTGNPLFPLFSYFVPTPSLNLNPITIVREVLFLFIGADDPINPIYFMTLPLIVFFYPTLKKDLKIMFYYSVGAVIIWYFTPHVGGGRFILPYLPTFSILCGYMITTINSKSLKKYLVGLVIFISLLSSGYRFLANRKYLPVIFGLQTKKDFLCHNLDFSFGDFYDCDEYLSNNLKKTDILYVNGIHNLFYMPLNFVDSSYATPDKYTYILSRTPVSSSQWQLIYRNHITEVHLYKNQKDKTKIR